jgi:hypothetical protein
MLEFIIYIISMDKIRYIPPEDVCREFMALLGAHKYTINGKYVYVLDFGNNYYKFGRTNNIKKNLYEYFNTHHYYSIIKLWDCGEYTNAIKKCIKVYAKSLNALESYRGETEIIKTNNIGVIIEFIDAIAAKIPAENMSDKEFYESIEDILVAKNIAGELIKRKKSAKPKKAIDENSLKYKCEKCERMFQRPNNLANHKKICI